MLSGMSAALAAIMIIGGVSPVFAGNQANVSVGGNDTDSIVSVDYDADVANPSNSASTEVTTKIDSTFTVLIPKHVYLAKDEEGKYGASYSVTVKGTDIRPDQEVTISVPETILFEETSGGKFSENLHQTANVSEDAMGAVSVSGENLLYVTQGDQSIDEDSEAVTYTITPITLTAGSWKGTAEFTITLANKTE